jgi:Kdo2-lipid IVA lauroyltransferase/acyltransferase
MTDRLEYIVFIAFSFLFKVIGLRFARKFSSLLAFIFFFIIPIRKETAIQNLKIAFPEYSQKEILHIAFESYRSFAIALVEILYLPQMSLDDVKKIIDCSNVDFIRKKYEENNGLILLSAHFGNWEYMAVSIGAQLAIPLSVVVKAQRNPYVTKWLDDARTRWNNKVVPLGISIRQVYKVLKDKNIVAMVADQRGPKEGIRINFFGRETSVYAGPAILALKTSAPILYGIAIRQPDYSYKCTFHEIKMDDLPEDQEEKVAEVSRRHNAYLEEVIREHPEQWLWMHKRWKY